MRALALAAALLCGAAGSSGAAQTLVSLTFDDGTADQLTAQQMLDARGLKGTFYINSARIGAGSPFMTLAQLQTIAAAGHEIAGHTLDHPDVTTLSPADLQREICGDRAQLLAWGFSPANFAYPFGAFNAAAEAMVQGCGYTSARIVGGLGCTNCPKAGPLPPGDRFAIPTQTSIQSTTTLAQMQGYVTAAEQAGGGWLVLVLHRACTDCGVYAVAPADLAAFLDWLGPRSAQGTVVRTVAEALAAAPPPPPPPPPTPSLGAVLFSDEFGGADRLLTNEFAHYNPNAAGALFSADWDVFGGSLFADSGAAWTGVPDAVSPNAASTNATGSAVFRAATRRTDFGDVAVAMDFTLSAFAATPTTPAQSWDGARLVLRRKSVNTFYAFTFNRRDNKIVLKKQAPAGSPTLAQVNYSVPVGAVQHVQGGVRDVGGAAVLDLSINGNTVMTVTDAGTGGAPILGTGGVGVFGDNAQLRFDNFTTYAYGVPPPPAPAPVLASLTPVNATAGAPGASVSALGAGFTSASVVRVNGFGRPTAFQDDGHVDVSLSAADLAAPTTSFLAVFTPGPGGGLSAALPFIIFPIPSPAPVLASLSPSSATVGTPGTAVSALGGGFVSASVVRFNGADRPTALVSAGRLDAQLSAADLAAPTTALITVFTPGPGGGLTDALPFLVYTPAPPPPGPGSVLYGDDFNRPDALITNEFAYFNPTNATAVFSPDWSVSAGSLFVNAGSAWTGVPDYQAPNATSSGATGSAVFRARTKRSDFGDAAVALTLTNHGFVSTPSTPAQPWDAAHLVLRYLSESSYYIVDFRRDNRAYLRRKAGTVLTTLAQVVYALPVNAPLALSLSARNNANGSVSLVLTLNGTALLSAVDSGGGGAPLVAPGAFGVRGENVNLRFDDLLVTDNSSGGAGLSAAAGADAAPAALDVDGVRVFPNPWKPDLHAGLPVRLDGLAASGDVRIYTIAGQWVRTLSAASGAAVWDLRNEAGERAAAGLYLFLATDASGTRRRGLIAVIR